MAKNHYKLLAIDIDGTLLDWQGNISAEDKEALDKARELGVQVSLSTGRALKASLSIVDRLSLDNYHMFFDGALISSPDQAEEFYVQPIIRTVVREMVEFSHLHGINLELYSTTRYFSERETWSTGAHRQFFDFEPAIMSFMDIWDQETIIKGGLVVTDPEEEAKAEIFRRQFDDCLHFTQARTPAYPGVIFNNILAPDVSKGKALEALSLHLGISLDEVMAVGDGTNDISLLSTAGLAIAMGNAHDDLKKVADHITLDVDHSGLAAAVNRFLL